MDAVDKAKREMKRKDQYEFSAKITFYSMILGVVTLLIIYMTQS